MLLLYSKVWSHWAHPFIISKSQHPQWRRQPGEQLWDTAQGCRFWPFINEPFKIKDVICKRPRAPRFMNKWRSSRGAQVGRQHETSEESTCIVWGISGIFHLARWQHGNGAHLVSARSCSREGLGERVQILNDWPHIYSARARSFIDNSERVTRLESVKANPPRAC